MALYSVWFRPFIRVYGPIPFTTVAMGIGAICLMTASGLGGGFAGLGELAPGNGSRWGISASSAAR